MKTPAATVFKKSRLDAGMVPPLFEILPAT
jgi:hypothetical protein